MLKKVLNEKDMVIVMVMVTVTIMVMVMVIGTSFFEKLFNSPNCTDDYGHKILQTSFMDGLYHLQVTGECLPQF